jgi:uncharacterized RDD family membrane protein YckC
MGKPYNTAAASPPADPTLRHRVRTPENAEFEYTLGSLGSRFLAWLFDNALVTGIVFVGMLVMTAAAGVGFREARVGFMSGVLGFVGLLIVFGAQWGYFVVCEWWMGGQTPGKRIFGLRVLSTDGVRITFEQSALRNLLRMADAFPVAAVVGTGDPLWHLFPLFFLPGALSAFLSPRAQRIGDTVAGTIVVEEVRRALPSAIVPPKERYNSFVEDPQVAEVLYRSLEPAQADALVSLCLRRDELDLRARLELFGRAAKLLEKRLSLPKPPLFSDEKYVLNLVAVLLGQDRAPPAPARGNFRGTARRSASA